MSEEVNYSEELSSLILEDYTCISCKINYAVNEDTEDPPEQLFSLLSYLLDLKLDVVFSTCGKHLNGKNKRPHVHWHLIVKDKLTGTFVTHNSTHRSRWMAKQDNVEFKMDNVSISFPKKKSPVWQHLAYPYKEGHVVNSPGRKLNFNVKKYQQFLTEYAVSLYQVSLGNRARDEACAERKKQALLDLEDLCKNNQSEFSNYVEMVRWLDTAYIQTLDFYKGEYPSTNNYKINCQQVAVKLGLIKYSDIIL